MIPELGHFALILALLVALVQSVLPLVGAQRRDPVLMGLARPAARVQFALVALAFGCLAWSFATSDFSVVNVAEHSNTQLPLHYRIAATWGSHEGSLLLWMLMLTGWATAVTFRSRNLPAVLLARVLAVMGLVSVGFLMFLLFTSNPFLRLVPAAVEGSDLNPLLQDPGMVIHPPMLYMGYVGFSVAFAFAIAALLGVLRAGLGRLVVLGPGRERVVHAVAGRHRAAALAGGDGKARHVQELDRAAGDRRVLAVAARHVPRALRRDHVGACVCHGPHARRVHPGVPRHRDRRLAHALCDARRRGGKCK
jgi:ABC-type amino acid transport substrate-binding protein